MNSLIRFENVSKYYNASPVIEGFTLEVGTGDVVGIVGPSGVGKSTLLNLAAGLDHPTTGRVIRVADRLGYVFQDPRLLPWKSALENVALPLIAQGISRSKARQTATRYLERMGLEDSIRHYPGQLSGGMAQRVALARAFAIRPDVLLLDEPLNALDPDRKESMRQLLEQMLHEHPMTVFYVTHHLEEIEGLVNRTIFLKSQGRVEVHGC